MVKLFTNNIGLKFWAVAFSCGLWIVINNINNPLETKNFYNVPLEIINASSITSENKVYDIEDGIDTVNVVVEGRSKVLDELTKDDIRAVADVAERNDMNKVGVKVSSTRNNSELNFKSSIESVQLVIEDRKSIDMRIAASVTDEPAEGYVVGQVSPSPNIVRLSGPASVIDNVKSVRAVTSVDNFSADINTSVELKLYDADDREIKNNSISMNISTVNIAVSILATKEVPLSFVATGTPKDDYMISGDITSNPGYVMLAGRKSTLDNITKLSVSDPAIDVTDKDESFTATVNIRKYLPTNTQFADSDYDGNVDVSVNIEGVVKKTLRIPSSKIVVDKVPAGYKVVTPELSDGGHTSYSIEISGIESEVSAIDANDIVGVVDMDLMLGKLGLSEWTEGQYQGDIIFNLPENVKLAQTYSLIVVLEPENDNEVNEEE